jgi:hypothetical protein
VASSGAKAAAAPQGCWLDDLKAKAAAKRKAAVLGQARQQHNKRPAHAGQAAGSDAVGSGMDGDIQPLDATPPLVYGAASYSVLYR